MSERPLPFDVRPHLQPLLYTPLLHYPWPDSEALNLALRALVLRAEAEGRGQRRPQVGGWHSEHKLFDWPEAPAQALRQRLTSVAEALTEFSATDLPGTTFTYRYESWANILRPGEYHQLHNHPNAVWSGVYYVSVGELAEHPSASGELELIDPRNGTNMLAVPGSIFERRLRIRPLPGLLLMFPAWLRHFVHPFHGTGERISISFNVQHPEIRLASGGRG